ncbi:hypothetical protein BGZ80_000269 [Entomortierella chlamydospora]|uniref:Uncharacterized protein n=1 Tax=Entomortierella chlamydospora TaxID=101097 RepID=A0A9P6N259_9FUNG|nr:hypothetical protein BGZ80_000269 [Entomortierella chlamydospora]
MLKDNSCHPVDVAASNTDNSSDDGVFCCICSKKLSKDSVRSHKRDCHDGLVERFHPLKCTWCSQSIKTHRGLSKHLSSCQKVLSLSIPLPCPHCKHEFQTTKDLSVHSESCEVWEQDTDDDVDIMRGFDEELVCVIGNMTGVQYMKTLFEPVELRYKNGEKSFGLRFPGVNKRVQDGSMTFVRPIKRRNSPAIVDIALETALKRHSYGGLVCSDDYRLSENGDEMWHMGFAGNGEFLATSLEGLLLQSGDMVLFVNKVEVFGRILSEDPHRLDVARPIGKRSFIVVNEWHDEAHKVMIGTVKWNALVTLAVILTNGTVIVGPDNKFFYPHVDSRVWIRKDKKTRLSNTMERQVRSKFDVKSTFGNFAAVNPLLNDFRTLPVTLKTLYEFKTDNAWSGLKVGAFVFHQLYNGQHKIIKAEVQSCMEEALKQFKDKPCKILDIVGQLLNVMAEEEGAPVSKEVNKHLIELVPKLSSEIWTLNKDKVLPAIMKRIDEILR